VLQLQEIIYGGAKSTLGPLVETGRETVNPCKWCQVAGRTYLAHEPGKQPNSGAYDITDLLTGNYPKFALVEVADPNC
jgi:hypothetical protein